MGLFRPRSEPGFRDHRVRPETCGYCVADELTELCLIRKYQTEAGDIHYASLCILPVGTHGKPVSATKPDQAIYAVLAHIFQCRFSAASDTRFRQSLMHFFGRFERGLHYSSLRAICA